MLDLSLEVLRVVENAAIASARTMGMGDANTSDQAAIEAMRRCMDTIPIEGTIVIGEGERDSAPMLYIGEKVGAANNSSQPLSVDIAVDPLEGTNLCASGAAGAIAVLAAAEHGGLLHAPDIYMDKLVVPGPARGRLDLAAPVEHNLKALARALDRDVDDLVVVVLDRPRHEPLIADIRRAGARIRLIGDGDLSAAISVAVSGTGVHAVMGIGGAPEGVLAAAALRCLGGEIQGRLWYRNEEERERTKGMGISDPDRIFRTEELVSGNNLIFAATGITDGDLFRGARLFGGGVRTSSLMMTLATREIRFVDTIHVQDPARVGVIRL